MSCCSMMHKREYNALQLATLIFFWVVTPKLGGDSMHHSFLHIAMHNQACKACPLGVDVLKGNLSRCLLLFYFFCRQNWLNTNSSQNLRRKRYVFSNRKVKRKLSNFRSCLIWILRRQHVQEPLFCETVHFCVGSCGATAALSEQKVADSIPTRW